jgi:drug/metabolite transporter (DMT)-like permease
MERTAAIDALAAIALWSTLAATSLRLESMPPFLLVGTALLLGALSGARGIRFAGLSPGLLALGIYGLFTYHLCPFLALRLAPPIDANLINYLWPLFIVVLSPLVLPGTKLRARHVAGAAGNFAFASRAAPGYALAFAAAVIWSTYSLMTKRFGAFPTGTGRLRPPRGPSSWAAPRSAPGRKLSMTSFCAADFGTPVSHRLW